MKQINANIFLLFFFSFVSTVFCQSTDSVKSREQKIYYYKYPESKIDKGHVLLFDENDKPINLRIDSVYNLWVELDEKESTIPDDVFKLYNLLSLRIAMNNVKEIPVTIKNLKKLEEIDFQHTKITALPVEIGVLTNLKKINLLGCNIKCLPKSIYNLKQLQELNLNRIGAKSLIRKKEQALLRKGLPNCKIYFNSEDFNKNLKP